MGGFINCSTGRDLHPSRLLDAYAGACCRQDGAPAPALRAWLGAEGAAALEASGACRERMAHVARREYTLRCNWKVFCDNYLVGRA